MSDPIDYVRQLRDLIRHRRKHEGLKLRERLFYRQAFDDFGKPYFVEVEGGYTKRAFTISGSKWDFMNDLYESGVKITRRGVVAQEHAKLYCALLTHTL